MRFIAPGHKCARDEHISLISDQKVARLFVEQGAYSKDQLMMDWVSFVRISFGPESSMGPLSV